MSHDRYGWTAAGNMYCIAYSNTKFPQVIRVNAATGKVRDLGRLVIIFWFSGGFRSLFGIWFKAKLLKDSVLFNSFRPQS